MLRSPHKVQVDPEMAKGSGSHKASQEGFVQIAHSSSLRFSLQIFSAHLALACSPKQPHCSQLEAHFTHSQLGRCPIW